jgi:hypothetical protein
MYNPEVETATRAEVESLQLLLLKTFVLSQLLVQLPI